MVLLVCKTLEWICSITCWLCHKYMPDDTALRVIMYTQYLICIEQLELILWTWCSIYISLWIIILIMIHRSAWTAVSLYIICMLSSSNDWDLLIICLWSFWADTDRHICSYVCNVMSIMGIIFQLNCMSSFYV